MLLLFKIIIKYIKKSTDQHNDEGKNYFTQIISVNNENTVRMF